MDTSVEASGSTGSTSFGTSVEATGGNNTTVADSGTGEALDASTGGSDSITGSGGGPTDCRAASDCEDGLLCINGACTSCSDLAEPDTECATALPQSPYCGEQGLCAACTDQTCGGDTPACNEGLGCVACSEHTQCPESACHLAGPDVGSCFSMDDVVEVQAPGAFGDLLQEVGPGEDRVLILGAGTYSFPVPGQADPYDVDGQREIAILGNGSTTIEGAVAANAGFFFPEKDASQLYFSQVEWEGVPAASPTYFPILAVGEGADLWLDDSTIRGTLYINGGDAHLRRSNVFDGAPSPYGFNDASIQGSGELYVENTSLEPGLDNVRVGGLVDIRYSTLVIDGDLICGDDLGGEVRNSIVLTSGSISESCEGAGWAGNAVNTSGFGVSVPPYMAGWFTATASIRFRLSQQGDAVFGDVAAWGEGDPLVDAEGDMRPTDGPSAAGADQP